MSIENIRYTAKKNLQYEIYFVDEDQSLCKTISEVLFDEGIRVHCFTHAQDCLEKLHSFKCNLLISAYKLPEMNGIELMKKAKLILPWLPVLIVTDNGDIPLAVSTIQAGAEDFLEKPLNKELFISKIKKILHNYYEINNSNINSLTKMEKMVFSLIIQGKNNKEISISLNRSKRTIENHRAHLMKKLSAHNVAELFKNASQSGMIDLIE